MKKILGGLIFISLLVGIGFYISNRLIPSSPTVYSMVSETFGTTSSEQVKHFIVVNNKMVSYNPASNFNLGSPIQGGSVPWSNPTIQSAESTGNQSLAVFLIHLKDATQPNKSKDGIKNKIFSKDSTFQRFYKENSYSNVSFSGDVFGWYNLDKASKGVGCSSSQESDNLGSKVSIDDILKIADANKISLSKYDRIVVIINEYPSCFPSGNAVIGKFPVRNLKLGLVWIDQATMDIDSSDLIKENTLTVNSKPLFNWTRFDMALSHEMGHSLGLEHSHGCNLDGKKYTGFCNSEEYGNWFDVMGSGYLARHFSLPAKERLGWVTNRIIPITQSGTYTIYPLEQTIGNIGAKIFTNSGTVVYLEYRQPIGYDRDLSRPELFFNTRGLLMNIMYPNNPSQYYLVDGSPGSHVSINDIHSRWIYDLDNAAVQYLSPYTVDNAKIEVVRGDAKSISFKVTFQ